MKGMKGADIHDDLKNVLGECALSYAAVKNWVAEFKRGRTSVQDELRPGRPKSVTTSEMVSKVHDMVLEDRRLKLSEIADNTGISKERVHHILSEELNMKKLSARWVPRLLTLDQKRVRMQNSQHCLDRFQRNKSDFLRRFVTTDETWVHHYTPESKIQSKQWTESGCSAPKKAKAVKSAGKVMASVFWDSNGILMIDYLPKGQTINGEYYANLLDKLQECIEQRRPGLARKKKFFIKTMQEFTRALRPWPKLTNCIMICCPTHLIHLILHRQTSICSQNSKLFWGDRNLKQMKRS